MLSYSIFGFKLLHQISPVCKNFGLCSWHTSVRRPSAHNAFASESKGSKVFKFSLPISPNDITDFPLPIYLLLLQYRIPGQSFRISCYCSPNMNNLTESGIAARSACGSLHLKDKIYLKYE